MARVRAAVVAAGRGVRMRDPRPKSLIPVGEREPLLFYILAGLKRAGVEDLLVVTGHGAAQIQEFVGRHWAEGKVTYVFNARYASWGNFHSVRVALDQAPGSDLMVVNSDIVVVPEVYERVVDKPGDLVLAVERRHRLDEEDMRVELKGDVVRKIGKNLKMSLSHGEYDGVSMLRPAAARRYLEHATTLEWKGKTSVYYEDVYAGILSEVDCRAAFVERGEYAEVDLPDELAVAGAVIDAHGDAWGAPREAAGA
jgi:choline kinase